MPRLAALDVSSNGGRSNAGARSTTGAVRRQGSGMVEPKDKSLPQSTNGQGQAFDEAAHEGSPKIGAYRGPISSITKHYFMANYNMGEDAASQAAASKSLDEKSSMHSETPLIPPRKWINTHAYIQGLTMILLVSLQSDLWAGMYKGSRG